MNISLTKKAPDYYLSIIFHSPFFTTAAMDILTMELFYLNENEYCLNNVDVFQSLYILKA